MHFILLAQKKTPRKHRYVAGPGRRGLVRFVKSESRPIWNGCQAGSTALRMKDNNVGAVVVLDRGVLQGMFSEGDVVLRIVLTKKDPEKTMVQDVMTTDVVAIQQTTTADDAVKLMKDWHIRHLPIIRDDGRVEGIVEIRNLFHEKFDDMTHELESLERYIATDGIGG